MAKFLDSKIAKPIAIFLFSFLILIASLSPALEGALNFLLWLDNIEKINNQFLMHSLGSASSHFAVFSGAKAVIDTMASTKAGFLGATINLGELLSPVRGIIDSAWKFFGYSIFSIVLQITILNFVKTIALKILVPAGAVFLAASTFTYKRILQKIGVIAILSGLILHIALPYSVFLGKIMFEETNVSTSVKLAENAGILKESLAEIKLFENKTARAKSANNLASNTINLITSAANSYFTNILVLFVITPLFFYGLIYIAFKESLAYLDEEKIANEFDDKLLSFAKSILPK